MTGRVAFLSGAAAGQRVGEGDPFRDGLVVMLALTTGVLAAFVAALAAVVTASLPAAVRRARPLLACPGLAGLPGKKLGQCGGELTQFGQVRLGQLSDQMVAFLGELHADNPGILLVLPPPDESAGFRPVHEAHRAVALQQQIVGEFSDRRRLRTRVPLDRHEQLMLGRGEAHGTRLLLAPPQETPQCHAEAQVVPEIIACRVNGTLFSPLAARDRIAIRTVRRCHIHYIVLRLYRVAILRAVPDAEWRPAR